MADRHHNHSVRAIYRGLLSYHLCGKHTPVVHNYTGNLPWSRQLGAVFHHYFHLHSDHNSDVTVLYELPQEHFDQGPPAGEKGVRERGDEELDKEGEDDSEGGEVEWEADEVSEGGGPGGFFLILYWLSY